MKSKMQYLWIVYRNRRQRGRQDLGKELAGKGRQISAHREKSGTGWGEQGTADIWSAQPCQLAEPTVAGCIYRPELLGQPENRIVAILGPIGFFQFIAQTQVFQLFRRIVELLAAGGADDTVDFLFRIADAEQYLFLPDDVQFCRRNQQVGHDVVIELGDVFISD
jgi:hypothetical protein